MQHTDLAAGRWHTLSLAQQLGNIGSEVSRTLTWKGKDPSVSQKAAERALELFDLTAQDLRWRGRLKEILRARELFCDAIAGGGVYGSSLESLEQYFFYFALLARAQSPHRPK